MPKAPEPVPEHKTLEQQIVELWASRGLGVVREIAGPARLQVFRRLGAEAVKDGTYVHVIVSREKERRKGA